MESELDIADRDAIQTITLLLSFPYSGYFVRKNNDRAKADHFKRRIVGFLLNTVSFMRKIHPRNGSGQR